MSLYHFILHLAFLAAVAVLVGIGVVSAAVGIPLMALAAGLVLGNQAVSAVVTRSGSKVGSAPSPGGN